MEWKSNSLEPPHYHNPKGLQEILTGPPSFVEFVSMDLRDAVQAICISTSITFASLYRFRLPRSELLKSALREASVKRPQKVQTFNNLTRYLAEQSYY